MKHRPINIVCLLLCIILFCGCAPQISLQEHSRYWIAKPLSELKQEMKDPDSYASKIGWEETTYPLANGNSVYVEPFRPDCVIHWEINKGGIIINYYAKGKDCLPDERSDASMINTRISDY